MLHSNEALSEGPAPRRFRNRAELRTCSLHVESNTLEAKRELEKCVAPRLDAGTFNPMLDYVSRHPITWLAGIGNCKCRIHAIWNWLTTCDVGKIKCASFRIPFDGISMPCPLESWLQRCPAESLVRPG